MLPSSQASSAPSNSHKKFFEVAIGVLSGVLLGIQLFFLISLTFLHQNNAYVVKPISVDAASAINIAENTRLFNDNHWYPYGPVYYRLAYLASFLHPGVDEMLHPLEKNQIRTHWSLMVVSLLSLYGIAWLMACTVTRETRYRLLATFCLVSIFLNHELYFKLVYVLGHPDLTLTLLAGAVAWALSCYLREPENKKYFYGAAFLTGTAISTKMSFALALPGMLFLFCPPFIRARLSRVIQFGATAMASYFMVGFPQNFKVEKAVEFLGKHSGFKEPATLDSFLDWWVLYAQYSWEVAGLLLAGILLLGIPFNGSPLNLTRPSQLRLGLFSLTPLFILSCLNWNLDTDYYALPFLILFWVCLAGILSSIHPGVALFHRKKTLQPIAGAVILVIVTWHYGIYPKKTEALSTKIQMQLKESHDIYQTAGFLFSQGKTLIVDRFAPVPFHKGRVEFAMDTPTLQRTFGQGWGDAMIFTASWYSRFLKDQPDAYDLAGLGRQTWDTLHVFYSQFIGKTEVTDPLGNRWKRIFIDKTGNQVWVKQPIKTSKNSTKNN